MIATTFFRNLDNLVDETSDVVGVDGVVVSVWPKFADVADAVTFGGGRGLFLVFK